ncbi:MAG: hypothetical protein PUK05_06380 [Peptoniphilaceae bacterium]|nr:hypothetical protein [Peptoniphilaceae bacterium]
MQSKMGSADFNEEAYEELQREIIKTSSQLDNYGKRLDASKSEQTNFESGQQNITRGIVNISAVYKTHYFLGSQ